MSIHLQNALRRLQDSASRLGKLVESQLERALRALKTRDVELAKQVIEADNDVDEAEVVLEEEILKLLALHQPVAMDLRFVVSVLKINNDLERIGDLSSNIAHNAIALAERETIPEDDLLTEMGARAEAMLHMSLESLLHADSQTAREVLALDADVDTRNKSLRSTLLAQMRREPDRILELQFLISISRHIERVADHATNIAEDVIYSAEGSIVRHQKTPLPT